MLHNLTKVSILPLVLFLSISETYLGARSVGSGVVSEIIQ